MTKNRIVTVPDFYNGYINEASNLPLIDALNQSLMMLGTSLEKDLGAIGDKIYAPDKWNVKDILQHLIDAERIFSYRALRFARKDRTPLPGFDENEYAPAASANDRTLSSLLDELRLVRQCSILLFKNMTDEMLLQSGPANGREISVLAIGFIIAGHQAHHLRVISEKYQPLVS